MDPISTLGAAGAALQFAQFAGSLLKSTKNIYRSAKGIPSKLESLETIDSELSNILTKFREDGVGEPEAALSELRLRASGPNSSLKDLIKGCQTDCARLLDIVKRIKSKGRSGPKVLRSFRVAVEDVLKREEVSMLQSRIEGYRDLIQLKFASSSR
jgi:hypothetical protein